jgi:hypothetical protein
MNSISVIAPYKRYDMWVFDDERRGLVEEPFVAGSDTLIDLATSGLPSPELGFLLLFSAADFPEAKLQLEWRRAERGGNIYFSTDFGAEGWLCPALMKYFDEPPAKLYIAVRPRPAA